MFQSLAKIRPTKWRILNCKIERHLNDYAQIVRAGYMPKYHAVFGDAPYALESIVKRFGKKDAAEAVESGDGSFRRLSKGFMGQDWDGFGSPQNYQRWVSSWAEPLLDFVYPGAVLVMFGGSRTYHRLVCGLEDAGWEIFDCISNWTYAQGFAKNKNLGNGYGTALEPANEPIVIARAPRKRFTYQYCFDEFGSSALNIEASRIGEGENGRFPKNFVLTHHPECNGHCHPDCHVLLMDEQSGIRKSGSSLSGKEPSSAGGKNEFGRWNRIPFEGYQDEGTAARFFYQAKTPNWEREAGLGDFALKQLRSSYDKAHRDAQGNDSGHPRRNIHPTVKPIQLCEMLARLILPPREDARLLIPFSGVGSEMIGAHLAGWKHITGIEMTSEYIPIAQARLRWWTRFDSYAMAENAAKELHPNQRTLFEVAQ